MKRATLIVLLVTLLVLLTGCVSQEVRQAQEMKQWQQCARDHVAVGWNSDSAADLCFSRYKWLGYYNGVPASLTGPMDYTESSSSSNLDADLLHLDLIGIQKEIRDQNRILENYRYRRW